MQKDSDLHSAPRPGEMLSSLSRFSRIGHYLRYFPVYFLDEYSEGGPNRSNLLALYAGYPGAPVRAFVNQSNRRPALMKSAHQEKVQSSRQRGWHRRFQRHRSDFPVRAVLLREDGYTEILGRCGDIGHGGLGAVLTEEIPKDEVLSLELSLPECDKPIVVRAIVRYRKGFLHGFEFLGLAAEQQSAVDAFCAALPPSA
jgi:hypothetical protein